MAKEEVTEISDIIESIENKGFTGKIRKGTDILSKGLKIVGKRMKKRYDKTKKSLEDKEFERRLKTMEIINRPEAKEVRQLTARINELMQQIKESFDTDIIETLSNELETNKEQLTSAKEKINNIGMEDISDKELKILATTITKVGTTFDSIFGEQDTGNRYEKELIKRVRKQAAVNGRLSDAAKDQLNQKAMLNKRIAKEKRAAKSKKKEDYSWLDNY